MDLTVIPRVPLLRTGHYELQSGPVDFAQEHLVSAANAWANDPAIVAPRIRIEGYGQEHLDGDGIAVEAAGGQGGPSVGWCDNLVVDGNTLYGDLHVPAVLGEAMEAFYPSRSIEGLFGFTTATGQTHDFVATGLLLLGTSWPGCSTLPDFAEIQAEFATAVAEGEITAAAAGFAALAADLLADARPVARLAVTARAPERLAQAGLNVGDLRMRWYGAEENGELEDLPESYSYYSWYVLESRVADDGTLYVVVLDESTGEQWRFDVSSISGTDVSFASPQRGSLDWSTAAASAPFRPALARYNGRPVRAASSSPPNPLTEDDHPMNDAQRRALAVVNGLDPETATEADIHAAAETRAAELAAEADATSTDDAATDDDAQVPEPAGVAARTVTVSREQWEQTQAAAAEGQQARQEQIAAERTADVTAKMEEGRITPAEAGLEQNADGTWPPGWRADYDAAPEVTARALDRLAKGTYPGTTARSGVQPQQGANGRAASLDRVLAAVPGARNRKETVSR